MPEDEPLALSVEHADGRITRWGPDEPNGKDIPNDLTFGDSIPGGYGTLSTSLLRRIDVQHADEALFDTVRAYGAGGRTAYEGYMAQFPRTHGDGFGVSPGAVGFSAMLRWDPSFREVYVDRDMSHWHESPLARKARNATAGVPQGHVPVSVVQGGMVWDIPNEALPINSLTEMHYDTGPGLAVSRLDYLGSRTGAFTNFEAATLYSSAVEDFATFASVGVTLDGVGRAQAVATPVRYVMLRVMNTAGVTPAAGHQQRYTALNVFGNHGLPITSSSDGFGGVTGSNVIADIVSRAAPQLTYTAGAGGSIESTSFVIPHLVYPDPITAEDAISDVNKYHLYDWGVYDDREFFYRQPDPDRLLWEARLSDGAHLDADGDTAEQVINGVFVTYTDATGITKTVGPPGGSFDDTDTVLEDTSSTNPVNAHGLGRKWVQLSLSFPTTLAGATQIGYVYLAERSLAGRRGTVTLTGTATHPTEGKVPCWRVRSGDWITLKDLNGATVPRKIINKTYTHGSRQVQLQLDNTVQKLDAILSRVGIQAGIATGGGF